MLSYRRLLLLLCILLTIKRVSSAQAHFTLSGKTDLPLTGTGLALNLGGWYAGKSVGGFSPKRLAGLDRNQVWRIDRPATQLFSSRADKASNAFLLSSAIAPALFLADKSIRNEGGAYVAMYLETVLLNGGFTLLTKNLAKRPRPYNYNPEAPLALKLKPDARKSFFSGHTSAAAASCFFAARVWSDYHPGNRWKPLVWTAAACIPALTGYLRIRAGRHFFTDVVTGFAVGATIGYLIPVLHKNETIH